MAATATLTACHIDAHGRAAESIIVLGILFARKVEVLRFATDFTVAFQKTDYAPCRLFTTPYSATPGPPPCPRRDLNSHTRSFVISAARITIVIKL
ncbi:hypothetical protein [Microtetraspora malaysiensis]|uniref:hypothetical protein n=1 Tax=Microtetraspora malaysiensis TaxID=161358 RepID=UPI003D946681